MNDSTRDRRGLRLIACCLIFALAESGLGSGGETDPEVIAARLKRLSLEELLQQEITSVSKRPEQLQHAAASVQVITGDEIRRSGASSLPEALRLASNLQVAQVDSRQWAISARGFNNTIANKLLVLIDGRTIYTPLFSGVFWDVQDTLLEDVERIEVISGPGGTLWGANAVNGVINVITRTARDTQGLLITGGAGTELRGFGGVRYGGALASNVFYRVYGKYFARDNTVFASGRNADNEWDFGQGGLRVDWEASAAHLLTFQGDLYDGAIEMPGPEDTRVFGANLLGRWNYTLNEESAMHLQVYYDRTERRIPGTFAEHLDTYDLDFNHRFAVGDHHRLMWGAGYRLYHDQVGNSGRLAFLPATVNRQLFSAFLHDEIVLVPDRLTADIGSKFEHNDYTGFEVQPSAHLTYMPVARHSLWTGISRAVRTPSRIDRDLFVPGNPPFAIAGGPDFVSEKLLAGEVGYRVQLADRISAGVSTFYHWYEELRSLEPQTGGPSLIENGLEGETYGIELSADFVLADWWRIRAGYTYFHKDLELKPGSNDANQGRGEGNDPGHQALLRSSIDLPGEVEFDLTVRYVDALPAPPVPAYVQLDARLAWRPKANIELAVVGQNLLDHQHPEFGAALTRQEIRRGVYGKVTWSF